MPHGTPPAAQPAPQVAQQPGDHTPKYPTIFMGGPPSVILSSPAPVTATATTYDDHNITPPPGSPGYTG